VWNRNGPWIFNKSHMGIQVFSTLTQSLFW
jgi:hypothetical protein